jgi:thiosulfate dehydrogenase (quinone) large subunit
VLQVAVRLQRGRLIWLVARLWLGWEWLQAGWSKLFGGNIT